MLTNHVVVSLLICAAVAALEGAAAGRGVRVHYQALRMPRLSPPLPLWIGIGIAYYVMCFVVLLRVLQSAPHTAARIVALMLTVVIMLANAGWGLLFFRLKNARASYIAFFPYAVLVAGLAVVLARVDRVAAFVLMPYMVYLAYAAWWTRAIWHLNDTGASRVP